MSIFGGSSTDPQYDDYGNDCRTLEGYTNDRKRMLQSQSKSVTEVLAYLEVLENPTENKRIMDTYRKNEDSIFDMLERHINPAESAIRETNEMTSEHRDRCKQDLRLIYAQKQLYLDLDGKQTYKESVTDIDQTALEISNSISDEIYKWHRNLQLQIRAQHAIAQGGAGAETGLLRTTEDMRAPFVDEPTLPSAIAAAPSPTSGSIFCTADFSTSPPEISITEPMLQGGAGAGTGSGSIETTIPLNPFHGVLASCPKDVVMSSKEMSI